ncbi:MAG: hypothetical protein ACPGII_10365, partial [Opitutales bacterium]
RRSKQGFRCRRTILRLIQFLDSYFLLVIGYWLLVIGYWLLVFVSCSSDCKAVLNIPRPCDMTSCVNDIALIQENDFPLRETKTLGGSSCPPRALVKLASPARRSKVDERAKSLVFAKDSVS